MAAATAADTTLSSGWWRLFGDTTLNRLVELSAEGNLQIAGALRRIEASQAALGATRAGYMPTINVSAGWTAMKNSGATTARHAETSAIRYFDLGADLSWEIDIFGRVAAQGREAGAALRLSRADYNAALLSVESSMAKAYFSLRLAQQMKIVATDQLESQRKILHITEVRRETGLSSGLDVAQATTTVLSTEATLPGYDSRIESAINSMAILVGCYPAQLRGQLLTPAPLPALPTALPDTSLQAMTASRPDIAAARAQVDEAAARLGITRKEWMPTLTVEASAGTRSSNINDLFTSDSFTWSVAPTLSWTLFDGLSRRYNDAAAKARLEAAVDSYNQTVLTAWTEVGNALSQYRSALLVEKAERGVAEQADRAFTLSLDLYKQGLTDFTNVQNAQISRLNAANAILQARADALTAVVTLFKSLGIYSE